MKTYELYPTFSGISCYSVNYRGILIKVKAVNIKQAYYLGANHIWMKHNKDTGIEEIYIRGKGHKNWKGDEWK